MPDFGITAILTVASIIISAAISVVQMVLTPRPKPPQAPRLADEGQTISRTLPVNYWRFIYGETRVGLVPVYKGLSGNRSYLHWLGIGACHAVNRIGTVFIGQHPVYPGDLAADGQVTRGRFMKPGTSLPQVRVRKLLGADDQAADPDLVSETEGEWSADHRCRGHSGVYFRYVINPSMFPSEPNPSAVIQGRLLYDPRDGGTRWSPNLALCIHDYMTTARIDGGYGATAAEFDATEWSSYANICEEFVASPTTGAAALVHTMQSIDAANDTIDLAASDTPGAADGPRLKFQTGDRVEADAARYGLATGTPYYVIVEQEVFSRQKDDDPNNPAYPRIALASTYANALARIKVDLTADTGALVLTKTGEPRWTCNGTFTTDQAPNRVVEDMLASSGASLVKSGGKYRLMGLAWAAPTLMLDEDDLRAPMKLQTKRPRRDRFNALKGTYLNPINDWQPSDYPALTVAAYQTQDQGERIFNEYEQKFTSRSGQAQRAAKLMLAAHRFERVVQYPAQLTAYDCKAHEIVAVTNARLAWAAKPFKILNRKPVLEQGEKAPYLGIDLSLNEASAAVFDWSSTEEQADPPILRPTLPSWTVVTAPGLPAVSESVYEGRSGSDRQVIVTMDWAASADGATAAYVLEFALTGTAAWQPFGPGRVLADLLSADAINLDPAVYDFSVRAENHLGALSPRAVTTKEITGLDADPAALANVTGVASGREFVMRWDLHSEADVLRGGHIEFRWSPLASGATADESVTVGDRIDGRSTTVSLPLRDGTYFARPVDKAGHVGPWSSVVNIGSTAESFTLSSTIIEETAFSGAKSGTVVIGSVLTLDGSSFIDSWGAVDGIANWDAEGGIAASGSYNFATAYDNGSVARLRLRAHVRCTTVNVLALIDSRTDPIDSWENFDGDSSPAAADAWEEVRSTNDDPAGSPVWSAWQRFDVAEFNARAFQFRAQLRSYDPAYRPELSELRVYIEHL